MSNLVWTNAKDAPCGFTYQKFLAAKLGFFTFGFGSLSVTIMLRSPEMFILGPLLIYALLSMYIGTLLLHSNIFNTRNLLFIWEDKVFLQRVGLFGWRVITRDKFRVGIFSYRAKENLDDPASPPYIVLEKPYKGKMCFIFSSDLVEVEETGVILRERDIRKLIEILKPRKILDGTYRLIEGYSHVIANFGEELRALAEELLNFDFKDLLFEIYKGKFEDINAALISLENTLSALAIYGLKPEAEKFIRCVIDGEILKYLNFLDLNICKKWSNFLSDVGSKTANIGGFIGFLASFIMIFNIIFGSALDLWLSLVVVISVSVNICRCIFIHYNGLIGDAGNEYFYGLLVGLFIDIFFTVFHVSIPFIVNYSVGPISFPFVFPYIHLYIIFSLVISLLNILSNIVRTDYIAYKKLIESWLQFLQIPQGSIK